MTRTPRRFNVGDLMILIAAIGAATLTLRNLWRGLTIAPGDRYWSVTPTRLFIASLLSAWATPMTLACLSFRVRRPRPAWRRVAIQPGTAALLVCAIIFAFQTVEVAASLSLSKLESFTNTKVSSIRFGESVSLIVMRSRSGNGLIGHVEPIGCFGVLTTSFASPCGPAVAAVWLLLALAGRWRPEASWIDRLGRLLGVTWIAISFLSSLPVR